MVGQVVNPKDLFTFKIAPFNGAIIAKLLQVISMGVYIRTNRYNYMEGRRCDGY